MKVNLLKGSLVVVALLILLVSSQAPEATAITYAPGGGPPQPLAQGDQPPRPLVDAVGIATGQPVVKRSDQAFASKPEAEIQTASVRSVGPGEIQIVGRLRYEAYEAGKSFGSELLRRAIVELWDHHPYGDTRLSQTRTNNNGYYAFDPVPNRPNIKLYLVIYATDYERIRVVDEINQIYSWQSSDIGKTSDGTHTFDYTIYRTSPTGKSQAFYIFDKTANLSYEKVEAWVHWGNRDLLEINWPEKCVPIREEQESCFHGEIYLREGDGDEPDTIIHEYGHFVLSRSLGVLRVVFACAPTFRHGSWEEVSPSCAYSEGWAEFFQMAVQNDPGSLENIETKLKGLTGNPENYAEIVAAILWDIFDGPSSPSISESFDKFRDGFNGPANNGIFYFSTTWPGPRIEQPGNIEEFWDYWRSNRLDDYCYTSDLIRHHVPKFPYTAHTFCDVPSTHPQYREIRTLYINGYVLGCSDYPDPPKYCPGNTMNRAESAVFVERGIHKSDYVPTDPKTQIFVDVPVYPNDPSRNPWYAKWANALWYDGYTGGCQALGQPLAFCPDKGHTRAEAAVFFLRMKNGRNYLPPDPRGIFSDVPKSMWYAKWAEAAYNTGLIQACGSSPLRFCPDAPLTRAAAAQIMVKAKGLKLASLQGANVETPSDLSLGLAPDDLSVEGLPSAAGLQYSTYMGGSSEDVGSSLAVDSAGNIYVVGYTASPDFPGSNSLFGNRDAFIAKLRADGSRPAYVTYLGGTDLDEGNSIAVDNVGNVYVVGYTDSSDFTTKNPLQPSYGGERDVFVAKLDTNGALVYSTYLGGSGTDEGFDLAIDGAGNAYVIGRTYSIDFPMAGSPQQGANAGGFDALAAKLDANGALVYSTYLGGTGTDVAHSVAVDSAGIVYITGETSSEDFPVTQGSVQASLGGGDDAFVAKLSIGGDQLVYCSYLGGSEGDGGRSITIGGAGDAYVTGQTASADFPLSNPLQTAHRGGSYDAFVAKLNASGSDFVYSTYLGGSDGDVGYGIVVDNAGLVTLTGHTSSEDFPTAGPQPTATSGFLDLFLTRLAASGNKLLYSNYLGGSAGEQAEGISIDSEGDAYVTGYTLSFNFPTQRPLQVASGGDRDVFVVKIGTYTTYLPLILK